MPHRARAAIHAQQKAEDEVRFLVAHFQREKQRLLSSYSAIANVKKAKLFSNTFETNLFEVTVSYREVSLMRDSGIFLNTFGNKELSFS